MIQIVEKRQDISTQKISVILNSYYIYPEFFFNANRNIRIHMSTVKRKILVVDDSTTNVVLLEAVFSSKGYMILTALSAIEAFSIIKKEKPAIVLLDLNMPEISGFDFLAQLKANEETADIPVVIVSALVDELNINRALSMGATAFINKPIDIPVLLNTVSGLLQIQNT